MRTAIASAASALALTAPLLAVSVGQVDDFQGGTTTMGWGVPGASPTPPSREPSGGPGGASDAYLKLTAIGGTGAGSRLSALNSAQWAGNYPAAGVGAIRMSVNNFGPDELHLRLLFEALPANPGPPEHLALSASAIVVPANSGWTTITFPITSADLVAGDLGTVAGALAGADVLRIFHNPSATFPGPGVGPPPVLAVLGVDNITALVPEPTATGLIAAVAVASASRRGRRR